MFSTLLPEGVHIVPSTVLSQPPGNIGWGLMKERTAQGDTVTNGDMNVDLSDPSPIF